MIRISIIDDKSIFGDNYIYLSNTYNLKILMGNPILKQIFLI